MYVFHQTKNEFVFSQDLSALTYENLGMFEVDARRKRTITRAKEGCCYHETAEYQVVPKQGLVLVEALIEDAIGQVRAKQVEVTRRKLKQGQWIETIEYYLIAEYYKH